MSEPLDPVVRPNSTRVIAALAIVISFIALAIAAWVTTAHPPASIEQARLTRWQHAKQLGVLRVGYGGFPPYTIINPNDNDPNKRVTGFSVDLVNEIAARTIPPLKVQWQQFSWDTMKADFAADRFDFVADPVYQTIPRAADFAFTAPYSYFGIAVAVVRSDDNRFTQFKDLDRPDITIALAEGYTSTEYARANLPKPKFHLVPVTGDAFNQLDEVLLGRADVALNDVPTVLQYVRAHKDKVKSLWLNAPPSSVAGGFLLRPTDIDLKEFLDVALVTLTIDGTVSRIDEKWKSLGFFPTLGLKAGAGLQDNR